MILLVAGAILGSVTFVILNPIKFDVFIVNITVLSLVIIYILVILFFIFKVKEILIKKFISGFKEETYGINKKVIDIAINYWEARKAYLSKRLDLDVKRNDVFIVSIEDMLKELKNYLAFTELEREVKFNIQNKIKNITTTKPISMIYTIVFSIAYQMIGFNEKRIDISVISRNNQIIIKYSLPNMELNIKEVKKYIRGKNNPEEIMDFDLVEKIINEQDGIKIKFTKNSIVVIIESIVKSIGIDDVEFINIYSAQNKNPKVLN